MNNISEFMNKIDIRSSAEAGLLLESMGVVTLGRFWNRITLSGDYWRFYYHDQPGAGVIVRGKKRLFREHRCYLLPPACNLESFCSGTPEQFFIHAELTRISSRISGDIVELPEGFEQHTVECLRNRVVAGEARTPAVRLAALSLIANALLLVPQSVFTAPELDVRVAAAREYINTRLDEELDLDLMAKQAGMSATAFLRLFKSECGITPYQYILQQRYNCASRLLKNSDLTIESICGTIGVKDRFHFSRQFKRLFGMPPGAYRQRYKPV